MAEYDPMGYALVASVLPETLGYIDCYYNE
jgi:hypothetical protein